MIINQWTCIIRLYCYVTDVRVLHAYLKFGIKKFFLKPQNLTKAWGHTPWPLTYMFSMACRHMNDAMESVDVT